ncbi:unnamed protein product [Leptidea sinapis]|uniref:Uncharacterized protein n=1 Tax=Leptidea sinapis TaxID=189913 RepID=A0A5E4QM10_9NEOP|nr:unnamed protein product [Leptidea sinapis]
MYHLECVVPSGSKSPVPRGQWTCTVCKSSSKVLSSTSALGGITTDGTLISNNELLSAVRKEVQEIISQTVSVELKKNSEELTGLQSIKSSIDYLSGVFDTVQLPPTTRAINPFEGSESTDHSYMTPQTYHTILKYTRNWISIGALLVVNFEERMTLDTKTENWMTMKMVLK